MSRGGKLYRAAVRFAGRFAPRGLILLYHRVTELPSDPQRLCVTPQHFAEHLDVIRQVGCPTSLRQLTQDLRRRRPPRRGIVLTFDDGYADNLLNGKPLLARLGIPGTVFVASGPLEASQEFWWDELERLLLQPGTLPDVLRLRINGNTWQHGMAAAACYTQEAGHEHRRWNVLEATDPTPRQAAYRSLCQLLRPLPAGKRERVLDDLRQCAAIGPACRPSHRPLAAAEVTQLADGGLIEVGAHSVTHPVLSSLPVAEQRWELQTGKVRLEEILGRPVVSFAYPYGTLPDYTEETVAIVRESGFACACSTVPRAVWKDADVFQLPRIVIRDWDGEEFARRLTGWLHG